MFETTAKACEALFRAAGPLDWTTLVARLGPDLAPVLAGVGGLPDGLLDAVIAHGEAALLVALAGNRDLPDDTRERLARTGRTEVVEAAYDPYGPWDAVVRRSALAAVRPGDPGVPKLLRSILRNAEHFTAVEAVLAAHKLHEARGPAWVRNALAMNRVGVFGEICDELTRGDLSGLLAAEEGTPGAIRALRGRVFVPGLYPDLDWDAVVAEHEDEPFHYESVAALAGRADCPAGALRALFATHSAVTVEHAYTVSADLWTTPVDGRVPAKALKDLAVRLLSSGPRLLDEGRPATVVLEALRARPEGSDAVLAALRERVAPLGDDLTAWRTLRARLKGAAGTVTELFEDVAKALATGTVHKGAFPRGNRPAFVPLLDAAVGVQLALLPHLDDKTVQELLAHGSWRPGWLAFALDTGDDRYRRFLADRAELPTEAVQALLDTGETGLRASLFNRPATTRAQRDRILSGPLDPEFRARLLGRSGGWLGRDAIACTDPELRRHILRHVRVRGLVPQAALLLAVWEAEGREAAFGLVDGDIGPTSYTRKPFGRSAKALMRRLSRLDAEAARAELRELVRAGETAEWQLAELRRDRNDHADLMKGSHAWHWDAILAAHREEPLPASALWAMAKTPGCPPELREAGELALPPWQGPALEALHRGVPIERILDDNRLDTYVFYGYGPNSVTATRRAGVLTWETLLAHGHPAKDAAACLADPADDDARTLLAGVLRETVGEDTDAWVLAVRLLPDFEGTLLELLRTAAAAV